MALVGREREELEQRCCRQTESEASAKEGGLRRRMTCGVPPFVMNGVVSFERALGCVLQQEQAGDVVSSQ